MAHLGKYGYVVLGIVKQLVSPTYFIQIKQDECVGDFLRIVKCDTPYSVNAGIVFTVSFIRIESG